MHEEKFKNLTKLVEQLLELEKAGKTTFINYAGHTNWAAVAVYDQEWASHKKPQFRIIVELLATETDDILPDMATTEKALEQLKNLE